MAVTTLVSLGIDDADGKSKRIPVYVVGTTTDADIQAAIDTLAADFDAAIDGKLMDVLVTKAFTLPSGLKGAPVGGSTVRLGALLGFDPANTNYNHSIYVPTWKAAGFAGVSVVNTGAYATLIAALHASYGAAPAPLTDPYGNNLGAFLGGKKTTRK